MLTNVPICLRHLSQKSDSLAKFFGWVLVNCRLVVGTWPEQASQTLVFSFCAHNLTCTLPARLERALTSTKWLFVKSKVIVCVNVLYGDKKKVFMTIFMQGRWKINVLPNLQRDYWNPVNKTGTPLSIYSRMAMPNNQTSPHRRNIGLL